MPAFPQPLPLGRVCRRKSNAKVSQGSVFMGMKVDTQKENKCFCGQYCLFCVFIHRIVLKEKMGNIEGWALYLFISCLGTRFLSLKCCFHITSTVLQILGAPGTKNVRFFPGLS